MKSKNALWIVTALLSGDSSSLSVRVDGRQSVVEILSR